MLKKTVAYIIIISTLMCLLVTGASAVESGPSYVVKGEYNPADSTYTASVYISNVVAFAGRFALSFDNSKLELVSPNSFSGVASGKVVIGTEGVDMSRVVSQDHGQVLLAWYCSGAELNASSENELIASVKFKLKPNVELNDFDAKTLSVGIITPEDGLGQWITGAQIIEKGLKNYHLLKMGDDSCNLKFEYNGVDVVPADSQKLTIQVKNLKGQGLSAKVQVNERIYQTDTNGKVETWIPKNSQSRYSISCDLYGQVVDNVAQGLYNIDIILKNDKELVEYLAANLGIEFAQGDNEKAVRKTFTLGSVADNGVSVVWASSNNNVISPYGNVFRPSQDTNVTMTATVSKGGQTAKREFNLTVLGKDSGDYVPDKPAGGFKDLDSVPWAKEAIQKLYDLKIINGISSTEFAPMNNILRCDFATLTIRMLNPRVDLSKTQDFADVFKTDYFYSEVMKAKAMGMVQGSGQGNFVPRENITRQDMMVMAYRGLVQLDYIDENAVDTLVLSKFADRQDIAAYAEKAVAVMVARGYIKGNEAQEISPKANTTRGEAAAFLYRIYSDINK